MVNVSKLTLCQRLVALIRERERKRKGSGLRIPEIIILCLLEKPLFLTIFQASKLFFALVYYLSSGQGSRRLRLKFSSGYCWTGGLFCSTWKGLWELQPVSGLLVYRIATKQGKTSWSRFPVFLNPFYSQLFVEGEKVDLFHQATSGRCLVKQCVFVGFPSQFWHILFRAVSSAFGWFSWENNVMKQELSWKIV